MSDKSNNLILGMFAGLTISLTSIGVTYLLNKQRKDDRSSSLSDAEQLGLVTQENKKLVIERDRCLRLLNLTESSNVNIHEDPKSYKILPQDIEKIRSIFNIYDLNNDGIISGDELINLAEKLGHPMTNDEYNDAMLTLDRNKDGNITFDKFLLWWHEMYNKKYDKYTNSRFKFISANLNPDTFKLENIKRQSTGIPETTEYRVRYYYKQNSGSLKPISPWHDIPLYHTSLPQANIYNFICEIPKWTRAKFEVATGEEFNPIKQDVKNGSLRYMKYGDYYFNYGCLPQTWEDPKHISDETKYPGDNDPIDVLEIGTKQLETGAVIPVKVLGILALIDDKETDWKIIAISIADPLAQLMNDIDDVETVMPGAIDAIRKYFREYKSWDGCINDFGLNAQAMPKSYAISIIDLVNEQWKSLSLSKQTTVHK